MKPNKPEYFDSSNLTVITVFHDDELNEADKSNLYRDIWKWFEDRCLPPKGLIID